MKENTKLTAIIIFLIFVIFLVAGGTYAYWSWTTSELQSTLINASPIDDARMYIDFPQEDLKHLYPTYDCDPKGTSSWITEITVQNNTGIELSPFFKLKVRIKDSSNNIITNTQAPGNDHEYRHYIKYAVTEENGKCDEPLFAGRFDNNTPTFTETEGWYDSNPITLREDNFPVVSGEPGTGVSFFARPNAETKHKYKIWVWMAEEYTSITYGQNITDKLQNAQISVSWSENSTLEQVRKSYAGTAYAVYSADDNSLRFYRSGTEIEEGKKYRGLTATTVYTGFEEDSFSSDTIPWKNIRESITSVYFEDNVYPKSTAYWFKDFTSATIIDIDNLDGSRNTNMDSMFYNTGVINLIGIENLDVSKVTSMYNTFSYNNGLTSLDLSKWNTASLKNTILMFDDFVTNELNMSGWNTSNVTNMNSMFYNSGIQNLIGAENWDTSNVTNMNSMFSYMYVNMNLDLRGWNVCKVTDYEYFSNSGITLIPYFGNPARCNGDTNVGKSHAVGEAIAIYFAEDSSLRFYRDMNPSSIKPGDTFDGRKVTEIYTNFENTNPSRNESPWNDCIYLIENIIFEDYIYPINTSYWFYDCYLVLNINLKKLDTSSVTSMESMFGMFGENNTDIIDLSHFNTSNVTNMNSMFSMMTNFEKLIGLENWDVSNVTDMSRMFSQDGTEYNFNFDLSGWNVCKVEQYNNFYPNNDLIRPNFGDPLRCNGGNPA